MTVKLVSDRLSATDGEEGLGGDNEVGDIVNAAVDGRGALELGEGFGDDRLVLLSPAHNHDYATVQ